MKANASSRTIVAILLFVGLAVAFWMILISPKREKADELGEQVSQLETTLAQSQAAVAAGEAAQHAFPHDYQQLVVLGQAVPAGDESSSLLVQLNHIADRSDVTFESLKVGAADESEPAPPVEEATPEEGAPEEGESAPETEEGAPTEESSSVPAAAVATESAASLEPIGARIGPAGLSVLPYEIAFKGRFSGVADFIHGIDGLIHTRGSKLAVDGRLVTLDGFVLSADAKRGFPHLNASFSVTTYLVPPGLGITAGASPTEPTVVEATPSTAATNLR